MIQDYAGKSFYVPDYVEGVYRRLDLTAMPYKRAERSVEGDPAEVLHQAGEAQQQQLVEQLATEGPTALPLLASAYSTSRTGRLRCYILDALEQMDDPRVLQLIEAGLTDPSSSVRAHAVEALIHRHEAGACELLLPLLADRNAEVRRSAIAATVQLDCRSEPTIAALMGGARDTDWRIRQAAARGLGALRVPEAADLLHSLTGDPRNAVRVAAEESLTFLRAT